MAALLADVIVAIHAIYVAYVVVLLHWACPVRMIPINSRIHPLQCPFAPVPDLLD